MLVQMLPQCHQYLTRGMAPMDKVVKETEWWTATAEEVADTAAGVEEVDIKVEVDGTTMAAVEDVVRGTTTIITTVTLDAVAEVSRQQWVVETVVEILRKTARQLWLYLRNCQAKRNRLIMFLPPRLELGRTDPVVCRVWTEELQEYIIFKHSIDCPFPGQSGYPLAF